MIAVIAVCAVLIVARGVTTVWLIEDAWAWWNSRESSSPVPSGRETSIRALPVPPVPAIDKALANRPLRGNPGTAFGPDSYPLEALRRGEAGRTVARLRVAATGAPTRCFIRTSSGSGILDRQTCRIAIARVRFLPARDARGAAIESEYVLPVRWQLPD